MAKRKPTKTHELRGNAPPFSKSNPSLPTLKEVNIHVYTVMAASWKFTVIEMPHVSRLHKTSTINRCWPSESNSQSPATLPSCHRPVPSLPIQRLPAWAPDLWLFKSLVRLKMCYADLAERRNYDGNHWKETSEIFLLSKSSNPKKSRWSISACFLPPKRSIKPAQEKNPYPVLRTSGEGGWASALMCCDSGI